jgi:hypothetical protein
LVIQPAKRDEHSLKARLRPRTHGRVMG